MSTIEECHLTNEKNPPKMLNYAKRRLSHAGFEMTQQQMPGGAWWWWLPCGPVLQMLSGARSGKEWGRVRVSLSQPVSPQTGFPLLGQLASSQSHTKCFDSLFSTQRNCQLLITDGAVGGPLTKESPDFLIYFSVKRALSAVFVYTGWLAGWLAGESVDYCTSHLLHIDTRYKYFWVNLLQITFLSRPLLPSARGRQQSDSECVVTANLQAGMTKYLPPHWCIIKQI